MNIKRIFKPLLTIFFGSFILSSCLVGMEDFDEIDAVYREEALNLTFQNNCGETIYMGYGVFNDTTQTLTTKMMLSGDVLIIPNGGTSKVIHIATKAKSLRYHILIVKSSTYNKYTNEELADKGIYDKKYELSFEQLESLNLEIKYDGH